MSKILILTILLNLAFPANSQLIQRTFDISSVPLNTWSTQQTFSVAEPGICSVYCLSNISNCAAFSVSDGVCEIGTIQGYMPLYDSSVGKQVYIVNNTGETGTGFAAMNLTKVPHIALMGIAFGSVDLSLAPALSPAITLPPPHPDIAIYGTAYSFYSGGRFYNCGALQTDVGATFVISDSCYSWQLGSVGTGFAKEAVPMLYLHGLGCGVFFNDTFWVSGGTNTSSTALQTYSEMWQAGKWREGPTLPLPMAYHEVVQLSPSQFLLIGGITLGFAILKDTWTYDFSTGLWTDRGAYLGLARFGMTAGMITMTDGKQYVLSAGGYNYVGDSNLVEKYDVALGIWSVGPQMAFGRFVASTLVYNNRMYVFAGYSMEVGYYTNVAVVYDPAIGWYNYSTPVGYGFSANPVIYNV